MEGDAQIKVLEKINKQLNNIPRKITTEKEKHVTFNENTAPPQKNNTTTGTLATKPRTTMQPSITKAIANKLIPNKISTPKVQFVGLRAIEIAYRA